MPNIFDGLAKASKQEIAYQLGLMDTVNMKSVMQPYVRKVHRGAVSVANTIGQIFNNQNSIKKPRSMTFQDYIELNAEKYQKHDRNTLIKMIENKLAERMGSINIYSSRDLISQKTIEMAAQFLEIPKELTSDQKADNIYVRFNLRMIENLQKELKKRSPEENQKIINVLQRSIDDMNDDQKRQVREALKVDELTGETVRAAFIGAGAPAVAFMTTVSIAGFGGYLALTTIIHAVFTTFMGITLPFAFYTGATSLLSILTGPIGMLLVAGVMAFQVNRGDRKLDKEFYSELVWFAVHSNGKFFAPQPKEELSKWVPSDESSELKQIELELEKVTNERNSALQKAAEYQNKYNDAQGQLGYAEQTLREARLNLERAVIREQILNEEKDLLLNEQSKAIKRLYVLKEQAQDQENLQEELRHERKTIDHYKIQLNSVYEKIRSNDEVLEYASGELDEMEEKVKLLEEENKQLREQCDLLQNIAEGEKAKVEEKTESKRIEIGKRWNIYFSDFIIEQRAIRDVASFSRTEIAVIEKHLNELHYEKDPRARSRGKVKDHAGEYDHIGFSLADGFPTRVLYQVISSQKPRMQIFRIYKHNEKFMQ